MKTTNYVVIRETREKRKKENESPVAVSNKRTEFGCRPTGQCIESEETTKKCPSTYTNIPKRAGPTATPVNWLRRYYCCIESIRRLSQQRKHHECGQKQPQHGNGAQRTNGRKYHQYVRSFM